MKIAKYKIWLFFFLLLYSFNAYTQNNTIDSLKKVLQTQKEDTNKVNTLYELNYQLRHISDFKNSTQYAEEGIALAEKINFKRGKAKSYLAIAWSYHFQSNYPEAIENALISLKQWEELEEKLGQAKVYFLLQAAYGMWGNYSESLKNVYASLKLWEELGDKDMVALCLNNLGVIYSSHGNQPEALKNTLAALKTYEELDDKTGIANCYNTLGEIYFANENYAEALQKQLAALKLSEELGDKGERSGIADCYRSIGNIYEKQGELSYKSGDKQTAIKKYAEAQENYLISLKEFEKIEYKDFIASTYIDLANISIKLKKFSEAEKYLQKSLPLSKKSGFKMGIRDSYSSLSNLDSVQGNYKQAYEHYKMYVLYRDSFLNQENTKKSLELKMQYEFDKKEAVAKAEQEKKDVEAQRTKNMQYFAIAALAILVLAVLIIAYIQWRNNMHRQKANLLLQQQKEKVESTLSELKATQTQLIQSEKMASLGELASGIAHEIQNPLNFVNNFSEINTELIDELKNELNAGNKEDAISLADDIKENEQKINHHGKRADAIVKGMLQHSQSSSGIKEPTNINKLADEYLKLAYYGLKAKDKSFDVVLTTGFDEAVGNINIIPQDIGRVILNLLNNAFYAIKEKKKLIGDGYEPTISVSTKKAGNIVEINVIDNGNGIPQKIIDKIFQPFFTTKPTGQATGLGLSLAYDIIKVNGGEITVNSKEGESTEFIVKLPAG